jgi:hypothetical protein
VSQVILPNVESGLWFVLGLSKWAKDPFGQSRTVSIVVEGEQYVWKARQPPISYRDKEPL